MNQVNNQSQNQNRRLQGWAIIAAIVVPIVIAAGAFSWFSDDRAEPLSDEVEQVVGHSDGQTADKSGEFAVQQSSMGDFDSGRQVPTHSSQADFWYQARTGSDRFFSAWDDAALAILGQRESPGLHEVKSALQHNVVEEIDINDMSPGSWVAVQTSEGHFAAFTIKSHAGISPGTLRLQYMLWKDDEANPGSDERK